MLAFQDSVILEQIAYTSNFLEKILNKVYDSILNKNATESFTFYRPPPNTQNRKQALKNTFNKDTQKVTRI